MEQEEINHMNYPRCDDLKEADAIAYVAIEPNKLIKYPFKLPELNPTEVRIKVTYTGLCHSDVHTVNGEWGACPYPLCPGHEIVGTIAELGSEVTEFKIGDKVGFGPQRDCCGECEPCKIGIENCCIGDVLQMYTYADMYWGGYATVLQQPAAFTFKLPDGIKEELTPPLLCAGITTYAPLARHCKPGDKVAVIGVGGLGHLAVQYAKALGCEVTAFSGSKEKEAMIRELGADRVLSSTDKKVVSGEFCKFKVVINTLPVFDESLFEAYLGTVLPNGHFIQVGLPPVEKPLSVPVFSVVGRQINISGSSIGNRKEMKEMLEFSVKHNIYPKCEQFEFDEFPKAWDKLVNGRPVFRCVVKCKDYFNK